MAVMNLLTEDEPGMASTIEHLLGDPAPSDGDELRPVPWRRVADDAIEDLTHELGAINVHLVGADAQVCCRPVGLRLTLQNQLFNAARYAGPTDACVDLHWQQADGHSETAVADQGPGVHPTDDTRIFDSRQTGTSGHPSDTASDGGLDLG